MVNEVTTTSIEITPGAVHFPGFIDPDRQSAILSTLRKAVRKAPLYRPVMPRSGRPLSVQMTNLGPLGWITDKSGYRYQPQHPETGDPWPPIPEPVLAVWNEVSGYPEPPEACLVNFYDGNARLGLHRDEDEAATDAPVVSISLGDTALFRLGGPGRKDRTRSLRLASGDVFVLGGPARLNFHGIDRIYPGTSTLLKDGGRINLTLRRVTVPD